MEAIYLNDLAMSRYNRYAARALNVLKKAKEIASLSGKPEMGVEEVLRAFLELPHNLISEAAAKRQLEVRPPKLVPSTTPVEKPALGADLRAVLDAAEASTSSQVDFPHILKAGADRFESKMKDWLFRNATDGISEPVEFDLSAVLKAEERAAPRSPIGGILGELGRELTAAGTTHLIVGRDSEIEALAAVLLKLFKPNAILLGDAGVGKTAVVEGLAQRIGAGTAPTGLASKRIVEITTTSILGGTSMHGEYEKRMRRIVEQAEQDPDLILFIDEIHMLMGAGDRSGGPHDMANILKPALARGKLHLIGATTQKEYQAGIGRDAALSRRFHVLQVSEPPEEVVRQILLKALPGLAAHHRLEIDEARVDETIRLCREEMPFRRFPDKGLDVIDRAGAACALAGAPQVLTKHLRDVVAGLSGIEFTSDSDTFRSRLQHLEERLGERILGQDAAIAAVCNVVRLCKHRMDLRPERPDGVLLFLGPTGVGKTALARALVEALTGRDEDPIRLDMTGFAEPHSISKLLGSPPGYVGFREEPAWLGELAKRPSAVLLIDELEKAHPDVLKAFLSAFDEGRITDATGTVHSLSNLTIIATSNAVPAGSSGIAGFGAMHTGADQAPLLGRLHGWFPPELLNRFDEIVLFNPLDENALVSIIERQLLPRTAASMKKNLNAELKLSPEAIRTLARTADPARFGARELERLFQKEILAPAMRLTHNRLDKDSSVAIHCDCDDKGKIRLFEIHR